MSEPWNDFMVLVAAINGCGAFTLLFTWGLLALALRSAHHKPTAAALGLAWTLTGAAAVEGLLVGAWTVGAYGEGEAVVYVACLALATIGSGLAVGLAVALLVLGPQEEATPQEDLWS